MNRLMVTRILLLTWLLSASAACAVVEESHTQRVGCQLIDDTQAAKGYAEIVCDGGVGTTASADSSIVYAWDSTAQGALAVTKEALEALLGGALMLP